MRCQRCGAEVGEGSSFCTSCGAPLADGRTTRISPDQVVGSQRCCSRCGAPLADGDAFCTSCGAPVAQASPSSAPQAGIDQSTTAMPPAWQQQAAGFAADPGAPAGSQAAHKTAPWVVVAVIVAVAALAGIVAILYANGTFDSLLGKGGGAPATTTASGQTSTAATSEASPAGSSSTASAASAAVRDVSVPDVSGMSYEAAKQALEDAGLALGHVDNSSGSGTQVVASSSPAGGTSVAEGTTVNLVMRAEGHRYELVMTPCTWQEASIDARSRGGYLARVESEDEWQEVLAILPSDTKAIWLGARRVDGIFEWEDGVPVTFSRWATTLKSDGTVDYEPNDDGGDEDYLATYYSKDTSGSYLWQWYDVPNDLSPYYKDSAIGYVVEYDS